jgi:Tol biopolymer transport system component/DNA-binding winged helix-turn-helix (wHTH) protein
MGKDGESTQIVRFGIYEADLQSRELRKNGHKVPLQGQPFQVFAILLQHSGKLVTREELRLQVWPEDTFVDFDHGLNTAITKIRTALGDEADNPRFVETLPRRGYRFIGQVERAEQANSTEAQASVNGQKDGIAGRGWKTGIAVASVILLIASGLRFSPIARHWLISLFTHQSQPQPLEAVPLTALPGQEISHSFSPDGSQVAFGWDGETNGAGFDLYVKVIGTDKPLRLTNHPAPWLGVAWSPDGHNIAVHRVATEDPGIFLVPALGGPERKLASTNNPLLWHPWATISWSPDGKQLAFADRVPLVGYSTQLFLLSLDTLERKQITTDCNWALEPSFSPFGDSLVYVCIRGDEAALSLNLLELRGGKNQRLFGGSQGIAGPTWTRDGARIIFSTGSSLTPFGGGELWQITPGRTESPEKVPVGHDVSSPVVSSSSKRLAYVQSRINGNIWRVDLDGAKAHARILVTSTREQYDPFISPDGRRVVFMSNRSGINEIWVCDSDGSNAQQLTSLGSSVTGTPRWSSDGKQLVFDSRAGGEANVYVLDAKGGVPRKLETETRKNSLPSWSHDGRWIYFNSGLTHDSLTVWRVAATGGRAVQLTKTASSMPIESPDGQYVHFVRFTEGQFRLWRMRPDGGGESTVDAMPALRSDGYDWWPSESGIYFYLDTGAKTELDFLDIRSSRIRRIYTFDKPPAPWLGGLSVSPDGKWLLYSRIDEAASDMMLVENFR